jgi:hypothetical protein
MSIFGGDTGITYEQLQQRKKMAERLRLMNTRTPRNTGEGIHALARALVARGVDKQNAEREGQLQDEFDQQYQAVFGGGFSSPPSTGGGNYADAIASIESAGSGDYSAIGPDTGKGRAYGRYQVMDFNIGPWTEKHLGRRS